MGTGCPNGFDSNMRLFGPAGTEIFVKDGGGSNLCSAFLPTDTQTKNLAVGSYSVCVEDYLNNGTSPPYLLLLQALPPGCGNGIVEGNEECDDSNTMDGDSCSAMCELTVYDCAPGEVEVAIPASDLPQTINDFPGAGATSVVNVAQTGTVTKVAVELGSLLHDWTSDVDITFKAPNAAVIELSTDNGGSGDNYTNTVFAAGLTSITTGTAPFTGLFAPEGNFSTIVGTQAAGNWTLSAVDDVGGIAGTLNSWTLHLCVQP